MFRAILMNFNPLNAELNPICHLLALLGGATIVVVSRLRVNTCYVRPPALAVAGVELKQKFSSFCMSLNIL